VSRIVPKLVSSREKNECYRDIAEEMFAAMESAPPTEAERCKEKCEPDHTKFESLGCKKAEPHEGKD